MKPVVNVLVFLKDYFRLLKILVVQGVTVYEVFQKTKYGFPNWSSEAVSFLVKFQA